MNAKPVSQRVRETEAKKRAAGLKEIRVWVPDDPAAIAQVRKLAAELVKKEG